jgi:membrane-associated phospholipid phosphatase
MTKNQSFLMNLKTFALPARSILSLFLLLVFCLGLFLPSSSSAATAVETAGDYLQYVLPVSAAAAGIAHRDSWGLAEFGVSAGVTLAATYGLKYAINERRPNGGRQSFPSGHASISFASAEFLRKRYGWEYGVPAYALASFVA